jgi:hypothetical protein
MTESMPASLYAIRSRALVRQDHSAPAALRRVASIDLRDLAWLRRVRIDREYAQPPDVEALARGAHMSVTKPKGIEKDEPALRSGFGY